MPVPSTLAKWNQDLAEAIAAVGSDQFFGLLIKAIHNRIPVDYPQVWLYHTELPPQCIYHEIPAAAQQAQIDDYLDDPYREDPFYQISLKQPRGRFYRLWDLVEDEIEGNSYYSEYYKDTRTVDEVIYLSLLDSGSIVNISLMRLPRRGRYDNKSLEILHSLAPAVSELIRSHAKMADFSTRYFMGPDIDGVIDHAFTAFGSSVLSPREKGVLELMLRGYGTNSSADKLGIAVETLRRHRKSIYRKLDVGSQTDLFSLFINSLSYLGEAGTGHPLSIYMSPPKQNERLI